MPIWLSWSWWSGNDGDDHHDGDDDDNHDDDDDDLYVGHSFQQWAAHADQSPYPKAPNMVIS